MKNFKSIFVLFVVVCMMCTMMVGVNASTDGGTVTLVPSATSVKAGEEFTIAVNYATAADYIFVGGSITLAKDTDYYTITGAALTSETKALFGDPQEKFATTGKFTANYVPNSDTDWDSFPSSGTYCVFTATAKKAGTVSIAPIKGSGATPKLAFRSKIDTTIAGKVDLVPHEDVAAVEYTIASDVTKYTVKFVDGADEVSSVEYEEGAVIVAPADPTPANGKAFDGWFADGVKFEAGATATANVTYVAQYSDLDVTAPSTSKEENLRETAAGYDNVWVGNYSATAAANTKITSVGVKFTEANVFSKAIESEGTVTFSIALIGVPEGTDLFGEVVTTAEWK